MLNKNSFEDIPGSFRKLQKSIQTEQLLTGKNQYLDTKQLWSVYDSGLETGKYSYQSEFGILVPQEFPNLRTYLEFYLKKQEGEAIGIEIAGPGSLLFKGFSSGLFKRSAGFVLVDHRKTEEVKQDDATRNHSVIVTEDIFSSQGYREIKNWLGNMKTDLIIERMASNTDNFSTEPVYLYSMLNRWYKLLNKNGVLLVAAPYVNYKSDNTLINYAAIKRWLLRIKNNYKGIIDIQTGIGDKNEASEGLLKLRLQKLEGAPEELPE